MEHLFDRGVSPNSEVIVEIGVGLLQKARTRSNVMQLYQSWAYTLRTLYPTDCLCLWLLYSK